MKAKAFFVSFVGLLLLLIVSSAVHSECYYYNWHSSCENEECDPEQTYFVYGTENSECECVGDDNGYWESCWEEESGGELCTVTYKVLNNDCGDVDVMSWAGIDLCESFPQ